METRKLSPTAAEQARLSSVLAAVRAAVSQEQTIRLPAYDPSTAVPGSNALSTVGIEPNPFGDTVATYRYQFEGEDDLLHLFIVGTDQATLTVEEAQAVAGWILDGVAPGLLWFKPGTTSHHFYLGHDVLIEALERKVDAG
ncbi:MAG: hypothetical protein JSS66_02485 [Armatimonadetes bacterium]|nr:hypothetical protein [Armatimonadota bacterium]